MRTSRLSASERNVLNFACAFAEGYIIQARRYDRHLLKVVNGQHAA